ncbi:hypothetical protein KGQ20_43820 [Catenulispora sp. NF23]|uniref:Uncharacterized protein n=1 Tax=Catenulispora pinistramenti TaxID=2705254 RepID=A0ABS5L7W6_9ACTN|nr:DUF6510 family protein [Catenulispora pinistramenti]MBS2539693.1 hypothetical protein [Catenulispora pinistramenti]MBS2554422.1 hypothetical protein [Catenulispora pinistramenti]
MPEPAHRFQRTPHPADPFADEPAVTEARYGDAVDGGCEDDYEDGNALAGPLSELFAVDVVSAQGQCTGCGTTGPIAQLRVYGPGPGLVARCPVCGQVVLRVVRGTESAWLDLRGTVSLQFRLGADR